jgi:peptide deformylase
MIKNIVTNKELLSLQSGKITNLTHIEEIVKDLIDTGNHWRGKPIGCAGLAANQIGEQWRIIIIWHGGEWIVMINPEVTLIKGMSPYAHEGCLSRPGVKKKLKRHRKLIVKYTDEFGEEIVKKYTGFAARVIQHEEAHLNGIFI